MDCSEADILIFNLQRKCKKNCGGSCGDSRWCREVWGRSHASQFSLYVWFRTWCSPGNLPFLFSLIMHTYACGCTCISRTTIERNSSLGYHHVVWRKWEYKLKSSIPPLFLWNKPQNHNWIHWKPTSGHRCSLLRGGRKWKSECPGGRGYSEFQVTGMNKWEGKSKPKTIPCRASNKTPKIPLPKMNPQKSHAEIPEPWKFPKTF